MKFLDEINVQKSKYEKIKKYEGKKSLIMSFKENGYTDKNFVRWKNNILFFEEVFISSVSENLEIAVVTSDSKEINIPYENYQDVLILNVEKLIHILELLFIENKRILINNSNNFKNINSINRLDSLEYFKFEKFFYEIENTYYYSGIKERSLLDKTIDYKKDVSTKRPFVIKFNKDTKNIILSKVTGCYANGLVIDSKNIELNDYLNGCFYGLCELNNMIQDISEYYKDYFKTSNKSLDKEVIQNISEKEIYEEKNIFAKLKKILSLNKKEAL